MSAVIDGMIRYLIAGALSAALAKERSTDTMPWTGSCRQCGRCCKNDNYWVGFPNEATKQAMLEFEQARGYKIVQIGTHMIQFRFKNPCPHLKQKKCDIYETRPQFCRVFPRAIDDQSEAGLDTQKFVPHGCGFKWEDA